MGRDSNVCTASGQVGPGAAERLSPALSHPCVRPGAEILSIEVWEAQFQGREQRGLGAGSPGQYLAGLRPSAHANPGSTFVVTAIIIPVTEGTPRLWLGQEPGRLGS